MIHCWRLIGRITLIIDLIFNEHAGGIAYKVKMKRVIPSSSCTTQCCRAGRAIGLINEAEAFELQPHEEVFA